MTELETKALLEQVKKASIEVLESNEKLKLIDGLKASIEGLASKADVDALKATLAEKSETADLLAKLEEVSLKLKALADNSNVTKGKRKSTAQELDAVKDQLVSLRTKRGESVNLELKSVGTLTEANVDAVGTNGLSMLLNDYEPGITPIPRSAPFIANLFNAVPTTGATVSYAEMKNPEGGAAMTAEGTLKSQADFELVEAKSDVKKVTAYIKTSKEALADISTLAGEINNELITLVNLKKDSQILSGDGTGNNLTGILTSATAFTAPSGLALAIPTPNNYDVLVAAITQIQTAEVVSGEPAGFMANVIVLNPIDVAAMKLTKSTTGEYVFPVTIPGTTSVMEIPVVANARMTAGSFLVMDTTKGSLRIREGISLNIGYENDDFTKNLVTILAEMRLTFYIKSQHVKAFVTDTFADVIAQLTAV